MNPLALGSGDVDPTRRVVARRRRMRVEASALLRGASVVARAWTRGGGGGWRARGMGTRASAPVATGTRARRSVRGETTRTFASSGSNEGEDDGETKTTKTKTKTKTKKKTSPYPESRSVTVNGERYRRCAAAIVFNDRGQVLCGERSDRKGSWNMPQGGIEKGETVEAAATRELFEETGVRAATGEDDGDVGLVRLVGALPEDDGYCYRVDESTWLAKRGLAGQRLEFCLFHWPGADGVSSDPTHHPAVNLAGENGESREFDRLRWMDFDDIVADVWPTKRVPYALARDVSRARVDAWLATTHDRV